MLTTAAGVHVPVVSPDGRRRRVDVVRRCDADRAGDAPRRGPARRPARHHLAAAEFSRHAWVRPRYETFTNKVDGFACTPASSSPRTSTRAGAIP
jgi:hypothetical protein